MRSILFQGDMILANQAGTKTQTRRVMRSQPDLDFQPAINGSKAFHNGPPLPFGASTVFTCPYGGAGDHLWVKETSFPVHLWKQYQIFAAVSPDYLYRADWLYREGQPGRESIIGRHRWTPSIFMPRAASRITLEITAIRCERLQQITPADARAEGVSDCYLQLTGKFPTRLDRTYDITTGQHPTPDEIAVANYRRLWNEINLPPKPVYQRGSREILSYISYPWSTLDFERAFPRAILSNPHGEIPQTWKHKPLTIIPNPWLWAITYRIVPQP